MNEKTYQEEILTIKSSTLFAQKTSWSGINIHDTAWYQKQIMEHGHFMPRAHAETNFSYKQIIPYVLCVFENKLFVMQRKTTASEQRLAGKLSLGIGGHMRQEDFQEKDLTSWAMREFYEEVSYALPIELNTVGILNDDSNDVGKVHLGIIFILYAQTDSITIKQEHKSGTLIPVSECLKMIEQFETWSQICLRFLESNPHFLKKT